MALNKLQLNAVDSVSRRLGDSGSLPRALFRPPVKGPIKCLRPVLASSRKPRASCSRDGQVKTEVKFSHKFCAGDARFAWMAIAYHHDAVAQMPGSATRPSSPLGAIRWAPGLPSWRTMNGSRRTGWARTSDAAVTITQERDMSCARMASR